MTRGNGAVLRFGSLFAGMVCPHCGVELMVTVTAVELKGMETLDQELGELPW